MDVFSIEYTIQQQFPKWKRLLFPNFIRFFFYIHRTSYSTYASIHLHVKHETRMVKMMKPFNETKRKKEANQSRKYKLLSLTWNKRIYRIISYIEKNNIKCNRETHLSWVEIRYGLTSNNLSSISTRLTVTSTFLLLILIIFFFSFGNFPLISIQSDLFIYLNIS